MEKTLESPLDSKEIKPINPKGNQPWIFSGRTDAKALILWPPDVKRWLVGKDLDAGKDWRREEKGTTEDEMVGWHHRLNGYEFGQIPGDGEGQGSLACRSSWDHRVRHGWAVEQQHSLLVTSPNSLKILSPGPLSFSLHHCPYHDAWWFQNPWTVHSIFLPPIFFIFLLPMNSSSTHC